MLIIMSATMTAAARLADFALTVGETLTNLCNHGTLCDYKTGDVLRPATAEEKAESDAEVARGHHEGVIIVDGRLCYVG